MDQNHTTHRDSRHEPHPARPSHACADTTPRPRADAALREFIGGSHPLAGVALNRDEHRAEEEHHGGTELVVPVDFAASSRAATQHADRLARKEGARLRFLHVRDVPPSICRQGSASILEFYAIEQEAKTRLAALTRSVDTEATFEFRVGDPAGVIIRRAKECGAERIVMGAHEHAGPGAVGSVAREVRSHATCPVLLVTATLNRVA